MSVGACLGVVMNGALMFGLLDGSGGPQSDQLALNRQTTAQRLP